jgi:uncharacterized protein (DUF2147 family)
MLMKKIFFATAIIISSAILMGFIQNNPDDRLLGIWEPSNGRARVKIEKIGTKYFGKIVWLKEPIDPETSKPKLDKNNPDISLRSVPLKGYRMLKDFIYKGEDEWAGGTIYDPLSGSTYSSVIKMKDDNTLDIRGYIGVSTFGKTDVWKRLQLSSKK